MYWIVPHTSPMQICYCVKADRRCQLTNRQYNNTNGDS